jgi:hypothetical protein
MKPLLNGWMCVVLSVAVLFAVTFIWAYQNPYVVRFEMDDNTLEAVKSVDWDSISRGSAHYVEENPKPSGFEDFYNDTSPWWLEEGCWKASDGCNRCCGDQNGTRTCTAMACFKMSDFCWKAHMYPNGTMECAVYD